MAAPRWTYLLMPSNYLNDETLEVLDVSALEAHSGDDPVQPHHLCAAFRTSERHSCLAIGSVPLARPRGNLARYDVRAEHGDGVQSPHRSSHRCSQPAHAIAAFAQRSPERLECLGFHPSLYSGIHWLNGF